MPKRPPTQAQSSSVIPQLNNHQIQSVSPGDNRFDDVGLSNCIACEPKTTWSQKAVRIESSISNGQIPQHAAINIERMVNHGNGSYRLASHDNEAEMSRYNIGKSINIATKKGIQGEQEGIKEAGQKTLSLISSPFKSDKVHAIVFTAGLPMSTSVNASPT